MQHVGKKVFLAVAQQPFEHGGESGIINNFDIERGTRVPFRCSDGRSVNVRYEPWIHPATLARSIHDTVYRGRSGENSWSPDVLIEVLTESGDRVKAARVDYAIVIDAK